MKNRTSWINIARAIAWFGFFGIICGGAVLGTVTGKANTGITLLFILVSIIVALIFTSGSFILLDAAEDLHAIRNSLEERQGQAQPVERPGTGEKPAEK